MIRATMYAASVHKARNIEQQSSLHVTSSWRIVVLAAAAAAAAAAGVVAPRGVGKGREGTGNGTILMDCRAAQTSTRSDSEYTVLT